MERAALAVGPTPDEQRRGLRTMGWLYVAVVLVAPIGLLVVPGLLFDPTDALATAHHLAAHDGLLRLGLASEVANQVIEVYLVLACYRQFVAVDRPLALQMLALGLAPVPMVLLNMGSELGAAMLAQHPPWALAGGPQQADVLAQLLVRLHGYGLALAEFFWGLWLLPLGLLIRRCGYLPPLLGTAALLAGCGYLMHASIAIIDARLARLAEPACNLLECGELAMVAGLLYHGLRPWRRERAAPGAAQHGS